MDFFRNELARAAVPALAVCLFFAILFLQSGLDKVADKSGNLDFLRAHFKGTIMGRSIEHLFTVLTYLELLAGLTSLIAAILIPFQVAAFMPFVAMILSTFTILCLFAGQRIAKDYVGAATLAVYFLIGVYGLGLSNVYFSAMSFLETNQG